MSERVTAGLILKPQGIRGEVKIKPYLDDPAELAALKEIYISGAPVRVLGGRADADAVYLALSGVADRNAAETLRGKTVEVRRDQIALEEGRYFIVDVLGCAVVTTAGTRVGEVTDITPAPTDIYTVRTADGREILFPLAPGVLVGVDVAAKTVTVDDRRFREVTEYAD